jgi:alkanesulfonate monooxygenase SsuD/methylene tetrahydromethanopterin reductase-like flavin-dependent oxidoreductase (luciferase family)
MASFPVRDPFTFAYQWGTLDMISGGRMLLAVCTGIVGGGASAREGAIWGVTDKQRAPAMEENMQICRLLWTGEKISYAGQFHSYTDVALDAVPVQQPCPIWIAANPSAEPFISRAMQRVAVMSDGWMTCEVFPGLFGLLKPKLDAELAACGKDAATFPNILYHNINIGTDQESSWEESKRFLDAYYGPVFSPAMVKAWTAAGTPQQCIDRIKELKAQGAQSMTFRITAWDQSGQYQRLVNEVLPYVN